MESTVSNNLLIIWGLDRIARGPAEPCTLANWIKDRPVLAAMQQLTCNTGAGQRAWELAELQIFFGRGFPGYQQNSTRSPGRRNGQAQSPRSFFSASRALASRDPPAAGGTNSRRIISKYSQ